MLPYVDPTEQLVTEKFLRDIERSKDFYCRLGFEIRVDRGTVVGFRSDEYSGTNPEPL